MTLPSRRSETDLKLLRVFATIVACGGFTPAQMQLNVSAATISGQMAELERRLGLRLCERGRSGFRVTEAGRKVLEAANHLFEAHRSFQTSVADLRGETVGILRLGIVDNTITNPDARIREALGRVAQAAEGIQIAITIDEPVSLERALLEGRADAAIAAFHHHAPGLAYEPLFREEQALYCGKGHPLFRRAPDKVSIEEINRCRYVARGYMGERQTPRLISPRRAGTSDHMEPIALLILSGQYIGYLPVHYALTWERTGSMRPLLPESLSYTSRFEIAYRRARLREPLLQCLVGELREAHRAAGSP